MKLISYEDLEVWQKSIELVTLIYELTRKLPKTEMFDLISQLRRCAVSIPSNIAEGQGRRSSKDFIHFLTVARGSKAELETQLTICVNIGYLNTEDIIIIMSQLNEISKMLNGLIAAIARKIEIGHTNHNTSYHHSTHKTVGTTHSQAESSHKPQATSH